MTTTLKLFPYPKSAHQAGYHAEALCKARFERAGYTVEAARGCDLRAVSPDGEVVRIECKGARRAIDGRWHYTLRKAGHTDINKSDVVFLVQFHPSGVIACYLVPVVFFKDARQTVVGASAHAYTGKLRPFRLDDDQ